MKANVIVKLKHDTGTVKIKIFADSLEDAINTACNTYNAPKSAVIYAKVEPLTIYDIKRLSAEKAPYFFDRKTMKFFKQTLSDFSATRYGNDKFYISAPSWGGNRTARIFNPFTGELEHLESLNIVNA